MLFNNNPNAKRDFIYRYEPQYNTPAYYIISKQEPVDKNGLWQIQTKNYAPILQSQQKFAFILRVNPIKSVKGRRHDIVMHEKYRIDYKNLAEDKRPSMRELIEKTGFEWLSKRAEQNGFSINQENIQIDAYHPHVTGHKRGKKAIRYNTMDFSGHLIVTDPEKFKEILMQGIGKSRAFGCGLLLIRRI